MQNKQKNSLKHFVRNILIRRLVLVTVLLCFLVGTVTYFKNSHNINERVTGIAQDRFETLRARTVEFMQEPNISLQQAVDKALTALSSIKFDNSAGNFVYFKILTTNGVNLAEKQIEQLIKGAFLHDVGKIGITDNILLKPGKLSDDEFTVMKTHVNLGLDIVKRSAWLADALDVVGSHHEKYDGSGYPEGLSGDDIPIYARIFAIADVFDALASERPYKKAFTFEKTMEILEESSGSHFDPELIDNFKIIAKALHDELKNLDDESLRLKLDDITHQYYSAGLESLMY